MTVTAPPHDAPPRIPARLWAIAAVTGAGAFMAMLDSTVANLALEAIRADFAAPFGLVQWVATGYLAALAVSLPATGWLARRYGQGRVWAASLALFTAASALCALAPDPASLVALRVVQGLAAGVMVPAGQAIVGAAADRRQLGRLMGVLGLVVALGPALGPALGGLLIEAASWRWLFWINLPVGIAALLAARGLVPRGGTDCADRFDVPGFAMLALGLPLLLYGASEAGTAGPDAAAALAVVAGAGLALGFVRRARRMSAPLIDLRLLRSRVFAAATATSGLTGASLYGGLLLLPLYLQTAAGLDAAGTGMLLLAMGLGSAFALPVAGTLTDRFGAGPVSLAGAGLLVATTLPFLVPGVLPLPVLTAILAMRGLGLAWAQMPAMTAAYGSVTAAQMGDAASLVNIVQRSGGAAGAVAMVAAIAMADGAYPVAFAALAVIGVLAMVGAGMLRRAEPTDEP